MVGIIQAVLFSRRIVTALPSHRNREERGEEGKKREDEDQTKREQMKEADKGRGIKERGRKKIRDREEKVKE